MITNDDILLIIKELKKQGISQKDLSNYCGITERALYQATYRQQFSKDLKNKIILYLSENEPRLYKTITDTIKMR